MTDPYAILGVPKGASFEQIQEAYQKKVLRYHPDQGGDAWAFREIQQAYEHLSKKHATNKSTNQQTGESSRKETTSSKSSDTDEAETIPDEQLTRYATVFAGVVVGAILGGFSSNLMGVNPFIGGLLGLILGGIAGKLASPIARE